MVTCCSLDTKANVGLICRVKELFDIIVYFPESQPGLEDIRVGLGSSSLACGFLTFLFQDCTAIHKPIKRTRMIEELGTAYVHMMRQTKFCFLTHSPPPRLPL